MTTKLIRYLEGKSLTLFEAGFSNVIFWRGGGGGGGSRTLDYSPWTLTIEINFAGC